MHQQLFKTLCMPLHFNYRKHKVWIPEELEPVASSKELTLLYTSIFYPHILISTPTSPPFPSWRKAAKPPHRLPVLPSFAGIHALQPFLSLVVWPPVCELLRTVPILPYTPLLLHVFPRAALYPHSHSWSQVPVLTLLCIVGTYDSTTQCMFSQ